jgi:hypothetical protein
MKRAEREKAIAILQKERKTALHDNVWAFDYAIASLKTDLKYDLMYEGEKIYTKDDIVAMLTEIQLGIEEHEESIIGHYGKETKESDFPSHKIERNNGRKECIDLIQQKIDKLKGE